MNKFILVSVDGDKNVLRESVDMFNLVDKSMQFESTVSSAMGAFNVLHENGYKIVIQSDSPYLYEAALHEASIKELWGKVRDQFGKEGDEEESFDDWYASEKAKRQEAGTWSPVSSENQKNASSGATPSAVRGVSNGSAGSSYSKRTRSDDSEEVKSPVKKTITGEELDKYKKNSKVILRTAKSILQKLFDNDKDSFTEFFNDIKGIEDLFERKYESLTENKE